MGTQVVDVLSAKTALFAKEGGEALDKSSKSLLLASDQLHRDAYHLGQQMANAELDGKLHGLTGDVRNLAIKETQEARSGSQSTGATRDQLLAKTAAIRELATGDWNPKPKEAEKKKTAGLVTAAEDQKTQAYRVAEQAEKLAGNLSDKSKAEQIRKLAKQVRQNADDLVDAAAAYDADPNNRDKEQRFLDAQNRLNKSIGEVVNLCGDQAAKDAMGNLFGLQGDSGDGSIFKLIDEVIEEIDAQKNVKDAQKGVNAAQNIGFKCKDLSSKLRTMAKGADPAFREQLLSYANGVRDQSLQLKIISAVKLADLGDGAAPADKHTSSGNQVAAQIRGLRSNLVALKKQMYGEALSRRTSNTVKQATAIRNIAQAFLAMN